MQIYIYIPQIHFYKYILHDEPNHSWHPWSGRDSCQNTSCSKECNKATNIFWVSIILIILHLKSTRNTQLLGEAKSRGTWTSGSNMATSKRKLAKLIQRPAWWNWTNLHTGNSGNHKKQEELAYEREVSWENYYWLGPYMLPDWQIYQRPVLCQGSQYQFSDWRLAWAK